MVSINIPKNVIVKPTTLVMQPTRRIDMHIHAFKHAQAFLNIVSAYAELHMQILSIEQINPSHNDGITLYGNGTIEAVRIAMQNTGIQYAVMKNIASSASAVMNANTWAIMLARNFNDIFPLGSLHLGHPTNLEEIEMLSHAGIKGVSFNSGWQGFDMDDPKMMEVYQALAKANMFALFHVGFDTNPRYPNFTSTSTLLKIHDRVPELKIIAAHMGMGVKPSRKLLQQLVGTENIWLDLAYFAEQVNLLETLSADTLRDWIEFALDRIGPDKVLYGSDFPWADPGRHIDFYRSLGLEPKILDAILYKNAAQVLGIPA